MQELATLNEYLRFAVTLTAVVDPFLAVPFFLAFTARRTQPEREALARTVAVSVFVVLAVSVVAGEALLGFIGASLPAFRVGGGLVLLLMALSMLNAQAGGVRQTSEEAQEMQAGAQGDELRASAQSGVVPLAFPLLAGPGAISTTIIAAEKGGLMHQLVIAACVAMVCVVSWAVLRRADAIERRLGLTGLNVATRILGLLLAAMAVQTMAEGLKALFPGLAH